MYTSFSSSQTHHDQPHLDFIFMYCAEHQQHQLSLHQWPKITGVFTKIDDLCQLLKHHARQHDRSSISITVTKNDLKRLPPSFMYTQLVKEILIDMGFDDGAKKEVADFCRG